MSRHITLVMVLAVVLLCVVSQTPQAQPDLQIQTGLTVLDSRGKRVGSVFGFTPTRIIEGIGSAPVVALKVNGVLLVLAVEPDRFVGTKTALLFGSSDCSGTPYLDVYDPEVRLMPTTAVVGGVVYAQNGNRQSVLISAWMSGQDTSPTSRTCRPITTPSTRNVVPAVPVLDVNAHFTPPFSIR